MRKLMFLLLLAGAAPALAADRDGERRSVFREHRDDGDKSNSDKPRREAPVARAPRSDGPGRAAGGSHVELPRADRPERAAAGDTARNLRQGSDSSAFDQRARKDGEGRATFPRRPVSEQVKPGGDSDTLRNWRRRDRDSVCCPKSGCV